jgi:hypothetical protein
MKLISATTILLSLILTSEFCLAQKTPKTSNGCVVKEAVKPSIFISYEAATGSGNYSTKTLLRLHNNTNCTIVIETSDLVTTPEADKLFKKLTTREPNGSTATTYIPDPPEGALLPVYYDEQITKDHKPKPANYWEGRDLVFEYYVPGERSITFPVDTKLFQKRVLISVPFSYEWEHPHELVTLGTIQHRVYYMYELPTGYYVAPK